MCVCVHACYIRTYPPTQVAHMLRLPPSHDDEESPHGPGCNCSTERQTKAQFLRLLNSLFDCVYGPDVMDPPFLPILRRALLTPTQLEAWRKLAGARPLFLYLNISFYPVFCFMVALSIAP
jgi:hypothetical protein